LLILQAEESQSIAHPQAETEFPEVSARELPVHLAVRNPDEVGRIPDAKLLHFSPVYVYHRLHTKFRPCQRTNRPKA
jgi:hypothetical protein